MARRKLDYLAVADLPSAPRNPKSHDDALLARSVARFGWIEPIVLDERTGAIVSGHGRRDELLRAEQAGEPAPDGIVVKDGRWLAPVQRGWSSRDDAEALAAGIALNQSTIAGGWKLDELAPALLELEALPEFALDGLGFEHGNIDEILATLAAEAVKDRPRASDDVPEPPKVPVTKPGDLIVLGEHRLLCGDSRDPDVFVVLLGDERAALCLTDPPYGVGIEYGEGFSDDETSVRALVTEVMPRAMNLAEVTFVTPGHRLMWTYQAPDWVLAWVEPAGMGMGPWGFTCFSPVLAYGKDPFLARGMGSRPDIFVGGGTRRDDDALDHPVSKPVAPWVWFLLRGSVAQGDLVLDPFAGSGTTLVACEQEGRRARCIELDPGYCDVIIQRWETLTGETAVRPE